MIEMIPIKIDHEVVGVGGSIPLDDLFVEKEAGGSIPRVGLFVIEEGTRNEKSSLCLFTELESYY